MNCTEKKTTKKYRNHISLEQEQCVRSMKEKMNRKEILKTHPYKVWVNPQGRWCSYLPVPYGNRTKTLISCRDKRALENKICGFYNADKEPTVGEMYHEWCNRRCELKQISQGTRARNDVIFNKFFEPIEDMTLSEMKIVDYVDFLEQAIATYDLTSKAFAGLKGVLVAMLNRAKRLELINYSGIDVANEFKAITEVRFRQKIFRDEEEVYDEVETAKIVRRLTLCRDQQEVALLLLFITGMRVGEVVALKHEDFGENYIKVSRTEIKYIVNGKQTREVKDTPKTMAGIRTVVIPSSFKWLLERIKHINPDKEWVFSTFLSDRMCTQTLERRLRKICEELNIPYRSPHKIRKTYCTILLDNGCDDNFIKQQVGHTNILTTERYYHRNRKALDRKAEIMDGIEEFAKLSYLENL